MEGRTNFFLEMENEIFLPISLEILAALHNQRCPESPIQSFLLTIEEIEERYGKEVAEKLNLVVSK